MPYQNLLVVGLVVLLLVGQHDGWVEEQFTVKKGGRAAFLRARKISTVPFFRGNLNLPEQFCNGEWHKYYIRVIYIYDLSRVPCSIYEYQSDLFSLQEDCILIQREDTPDDDVCRQTQRNETRRDD